MDVTVIIVNYNTKKLLYNCLQSVFKETKDIQFEIIIVDNASKDGSQEMIKTSFKTLQLIELDKNIGFGKANNEGIKIAKGRNILFLNPDTILINNAIKVLSDFLDENINAGACGGNLFTIDLKPNFSFMPFFPTIPHELNLLSKKMFYRIILGKSFEFNYTHIPKKVAYVTGADMMVKASCLTKVGIFDPEFFMYYEETELSLRIKKANYEIFSVPEAKIIHLEGGSFSISIESQKLSLISRNIFLKKAKKTILYQKISNFIYYFVCLAGLIQAKIKKQDNTCRFWMYTMKEFRKINTNSKN